MPEPGLQESLPAAWYHHSEIFERERVRIFRRHWWLVGRSEQLLEPGEYVATRLATWPIVVLRDEQGGLRAFHNVCRHRAGPIVAQGQGRAHRLTCRYHGWCYGLDGTLLKAPALTTGGDFDAGQYPLFGLSVETWNGLVFARLEERGPNLLEWLGQVVEIAEGFPGIADLRYRGEVTMTGRANWKTYADNSCEGYHVKLVHKGLGQAVPEDAVEIRGYDRGQFVGFDVRYRPTTADPSRRGRGFWIYKFPGLLLHFAEDGFNVECVLPLGPGEIELRRWFWFTTDMADEEAKIAMASSEQVMREDLEICAAVQVNLAAGVYQRGVVLPSQEPGTLFFQRQVRAALNA